MHVERVDLMLALVFIFFIVVLIRYRPGVEDIHSIVELANTKGGIIIVLWATSMLFFMSGIRMVYWAVGEQMDGKLTVDNALVVACFSFITGSAFGGAFGAMIKTMTGESLPPITKSTSQTTTTTEEIQK